MVHRHAEIASDYGLTIIAMDDLTIERQGEPGHFTFRSGPGRRKVSRRRIAELEALVLPPAWREVRCAPHADDHLQAVGRDDKGRLQYRYHDEWSRVRDAVKAERLIRFGRVLPDIRRRIDSDLDDTDRPKRVMKAAAAALLDRKFIRIGGEEYAKQGTSGATTLQSKHVKPARSHTRIAFRGKSGKRVNLAVRGKRLRKHLDRFRKSGGSRLFAERRRGQSWRLTASVLNDYLNKGLRKRISAKDFRTFAASSLALENFCRFEADNQDASTTGRKKAVVKTMKRVAKALRNTPAVARSSYVHPALVEAFEEGTLDPKLIRGRARDGLSNAETGLMRFMEGVS